MVVVISNVRGDVAALPLRLLLPMLVGVGAAERSLSAALCSRLESRVGHGGRVGAEGEGAAERSLSAALCSRLEVGQRGELGRGRAGQGRGEN